MKILFIFHMGTLRGGASQSGLNLIKGLRSLGHEIDVLCPGDGDLCSILAQEGFNYRVYPYKMAWPYTKKTLGAFTKFLPRLIRDRLINGRALKELESWVKDISPDIIHSNTSVMNVGFSLAKNLTLPHVTHFREFGFADTGFAEWHIPQMKRYDAQYNIAITKAIARHHRLGEDNSRIIYNGVFDNSDYAPYQGERKGVLFVGGITSAKGIRDLINAYSMLPERLREDNPLQIVGSTSDREYLQSLQHLVKHLGISSNVEWLGQRDDVFGIMKRTKVLVVPSKSEAFGRVVAEGMYNGCIVIGKNSHGIKEQFDNGLQISGHEIGIRYKAEQELIESLDKALSLPQESFSTLRQDAFRTVVALYGNEAYVKSVEGFYKEILDMEAKKLQLSKKGH